MSSLEQVGAALQALYQHGTDAARRREANAWLENFQSTPEAWQAADAILHTPTAGTEAQFFAANMLKHKLTYNFTQLPADALPSLRTSLFSLLQTYKAGPQVILTRLCVAVAILALQMPQWQCCVRTLIDEFGGSKGTEFLPCLLELLIVLPEECGNHRVNISNERRREFENELATCSPDVFSLLCLCMQSCGSDSNAQAKVFQCFGSWVWLPDTNLEELAKNPLVPTSFDALPAPPLFDAASDVVVRLLRVSENIARAQPLVAVLLPRVVSLQPLFSKALQDEDEELAQGIARIFAETGEAYMELVVAGDPNALAVVQLLCQCVGHPHRTIAEMTFQFWFNLAKTLVSSMDPEPARQARIDQFLPCYAIVVETLLKQVQFPSKKMEAGEEDEHRQFRHSVVETLLDCCTLLTPDGCLKLLMDRLQAHANAAGGLAQLVATPEGILQTEAVMFCVRSIGRIVLSSEAVVLPQIMDMLPHLPKDPRMQYTMTLLLGRYGDWLNQHSQYLSAALDYTRSGLEVLDMTAKASCLALKNICECCGTHMIAVMPMLLQIHTQLYEAEMPHLALGDKLQVTEALTHVVSAVPPASLQESLQTLCLPVATALHTLLSQPDASVQKLVEQVEVITVIFRFANAKAPEKPCVFNVFAQVWPLIDQLLTKHIGNLDLVEKLCRCIKYAVRSCDTAFAPLVPALLPRLVEGYQSPLSTHHSAFIYCCSSIVSVFGRELRARLAGEAGAADTVPLPVFAKMVTDISVTTFSIFQNPANFQQMPENVDDFFRLLSNVLSYCPELALPPHQSDTYVRDIFLCALAATVVEHREACGTLYSFLRQYMELALSPQAAGPAAAGRHPLSASPTPATPISTAIASVLTQHGVQLVQCLLAAIGGGVPTSRVPRVADVLMALLALAPAQASAWLPQALASLPPHISTCAARVNFAERLGQVTSVANSAGCTPKAGSLPRELERKFRDAIWDLSATCRPAAAAGAGGFSASEQGQGFGGGG